MRILLLANQPERTTRLKMFGNTLKSQGHEVIIPTFGTRDWIKIASQAKKITRERKPDVVHIFNVPDIIYHGFGSLRGSCYGKLIYDYRSPWGIELGQTFGDPGKRLAERFEKSLARSADIITTVNEPLGRKVKEYAPKKDWDVYVIPNYPYSSFSEVKADSNAQEWVIEPGKNPVIFIGRICTQEGIGKLLEVAKAIPGQEFWIIGDGPFAKWYLWNKPQNLRVLGWQPHDRIAALLKKAKLCLIPREEDALTPYSTDKSVWKLNEYISIGKIVVASGVTMEEKRKNLVVVKSKELVDAVIENLRREPEKLNQMDFRFWEGNNNLIKEIYESF